MSADQTGQTIAAAGPCPLPFAEHTEVLLGHGSGGRLSARLIENLFIPAFRNPYLECLDDQAVFEVNGVRLAFTTDSFVVTPLEFPGGDIGCLAVNGTINDLAMCGARPLYLSAGLIIEEGLPLARLERVVASMSRACTRAEVLLVTGDTKVVNRGSADQLFINTSGIGLVEGQARIAASMARPGDRILVSGTIGDHGTAIMAAREELELKSTLASDTASLSPLVQAMLATGADIHCLRDPTRGGLATSLNELARRSHVGIEVDEMRVPIREDVKGLCEILGLDPLYVANEGKLVAVVAQVDADRVLTCMRAHPLGAQSAIIGEVVERHPDMVVMHTAIGGSRILDLMTGEQLPRIC